MDQRTNQGEVIKTWGVFTLWNKHRTLEPPSNRMAQLRNTARHEAGHGLGLANAGNCQPGTTIMNPSWIEKTFITECDNNKINTDPVYASASPSPTPTPQQSCPDICPDAQAFFRSTCFGGVDWCLYPATGCEDGLLNTGRCCCVPSISTPVVIDIAGNGFRMTRIVGRRGPLVDMHILRILVDCQQV